jgi:hypothetical protein
VYLKTRPPATCLATATRGIGAQKRGAVSATPRPVRGAVAETERRATAVAATETAALMARSVRTARTTARSASGGSACSPVAPILATRAIRCGVHSLKTAMSSRSVSLIQPLIVLRGASSTNARREWSVLEGNAIGHATTTYAGSEIFGVDRTLPLSESSASWQRETRARRGAPSKAARQRRSV